jgi:non-specific serine/threonine protein kinase
VDNQEAQFGLRLAGSLNFFWQLYGSTSEGRAWVQRLLALPGADEPTAARASALLAGAWLESLAGDFTTARGFCQEALSLSREVGDGPLERMALHFSAVAIIQQDLGAAEEYLHQAVACARAAGETVGEAASVQLLGMIACDRGDYTAAQPLAEEGLRLARLSGDAWSEGWSLGPLGRAVLGQAALDQARAILETGLSVARQPGSPPTLTAFILSLLGEVGTALGQFEQAEAWLVTSLRLQHECGERWIMNQTLERLAAVAAARGQAERAMRLAGAAAGVSERLGIQRPPAEQQKLERWLQPQRQVLGAHAGDLAWSQGRALELEDAVEFALGSDEPEVPQPGAAPVARAAQGLTAREQEVAAFLADGLTNRQIAERLMVTERTVATHVEHILDKLGFASRHQVGAWVTEYGLPS